jgi:hypothetical protein
MPPPGKSGTRFGDVFSSMPAYTLGVIGMRDGEGKELERKYRGVSPHQENQMVESAVVEKKGWIGGARETVARVSKDTRDFLADAFYIQFSRRSPLKMDADTIVDANDRVSPFSGGYAHLSPDITGSTTGESTGLRVAFRATLVYANDGKRDGDNGGFGNDPYSSAWCPYAPFPGFGWNTEHTHLWQWYTKEGGGYETDIARILNPVSSPVSSVVSRVLSVLRLYQTAHERDTDVKILELLNALEGIKKRHTDAYAKAQDRIYPRMMSTELRTGTMSPATRDHINSRRGVLGGGAALETCVRVIYVPVNETELSAVQIVLAAGIDRAVASKARERDYVGVFTKIHVVPVLRKREGKGEEEEGGGDSEDDYADGIFMTTPIDEARKALETAVAEREKMMEVFDDAIRTQNPVMERYAMNQVGMLVDRIRNLKDVLKSLEDLDGSRKADPRPLPSPIDLDASFQADPPLRAKGVHHTDATLRKLWYSITSTLWDPNDKEVVEGVWAHPLGGGPEDAHISELAVEYELRAGEFQEMDLYSIRVTFAFHGIAGDPNPRRPPLSLWITAAVVRLNGVADSTSATLTRFPFTGRGKTGIAPRDMAIADPGAIVLTQWKNEDTWKEVWGAIMENVEFKMYDKTNYRTVDGLDIRLDNMNRFLGYVLDDTAGLLDDLRVEMGRFLERIPKLISINADEWKGLDKTSESAKREYVRGFLFPRAGAPPLILDAPYPALRALIKFEDDTKAMREFWKTREGLGRTDIRIRRERKYGTSEVAAKDPVLAQMERADGVRDAWKSVAQREIREENRKAKIDPGAARVAPKKLGKEERSRYWYGRNKYESTLSQRMIDAEFVLWDMNKKYYKVLDMVRDCERSGVALYYAPTLRRWVVYNRSTLTQSEIQRMHADTFHVVHNVLYGRILDTALDLARCRVEIGENFSGYVWDRIGAILESQYTEEDWKAVEEEGDANRARVKKYQESGAAAQKKIDAGTQVALHIYQFVRMFNDASFTPWKHDVAEVEMYPESFVYWMAQPGTWKALGLTLSGGVGLAWNTGMAGPPGNGQSTRLGLNNETTYRRAMDMYEKWKELKENPSGEADELWGRCEKFAAWYVDTYTVLVQANYLDHLGTRYVSRESIVAKSGLGVALANMTVLMEWLDRMMFIVDDADVENVLQTAERLDPIRDKALAFKVSAPQTNVPVVKKVTDYASLNIETLRYNLELSIEQRNYRQAELSELLETYRNEAKDWSQLEKNALLNKMRTKKAEIESAHDVVKRQEKLISEYRDWMRKENRRRREEEETEEAGKYTYAPLLALGRGWLPRFKEQNVEKEDKYRFAPFEELLQEFVDPPKDLTSNPYDGVSFAPEWMMYPREGGTEAFIAAHSGHIVMVMEVVRRILNDAAFFYMDGRMNGRYYGTHDENNNLIPSSKYSKMVVPDTTWARIEYIFEDDQRAQMYDIHNKLRAMELKFGQSIQKGFEPTHFPPVTPTFPQPPVVKLALSEPEPAETKKEAKKKKTKNPTPSALLVVRSALASVAELDRLASRAATYASYFSAGLPTARLFREVSSGNPWARLALAKHEGSNASVGAARHQIRTRILGLHDNVSGACRELGARGEGALVARIVSAHGRAAKRLEKCIRSPDCAASALWE